MEVKDGQPSLCHYPENMKFQCTLVSVALLGSAVAQQKPERTFWPNCTEEPLSSNGVCDQKLSPPERATALVAALHAEEKLENIIRYIWESLVSVKGFEQKH